MHMVHLRTTPLPGSPQVFSTCRSSPSIHRNSRRLPMAAERQEKGSKPEYEPYEARAACAYGGISPRPGKGLTHKSELTMRRELARGGEVCILARSITQVPSLPCRDACQSSGGFHPVSFMRAHCLIIILILYHSLSLWAECSIFPISRCIAKD